MSNEGSGTNMDRELRELNERALEEMADYNVWLVDGLCSGLNEEGTVYLRLNPSEVHYFAGTAVPDDRRHNGYLRRQLSVLQSYFIGEEQHSESLRVKTYLAFHKGNKYWLREEHWQKEDDRRLVLKATIHEPSKSGI